jgi:cyclohexanecarboxylate-CoA ligase
MSDTLWELVEARAAASPDGTMLVDEQGRRETFAGFRQRALATAAWLHGLGVRRGDVVSWELPTWIETVALAAGLSRLGAVQNPIIAIYRDREVAFCARQTGARLLITPGRWRGFDYGAMGERIAAEVDHLTPVEVERGAFPAGDPAVLPAYEPGPTSGPDSVRYLCYTSGTTSDPKGARHSDGTISALARSLAERLQVEFGDRYSLVFPFPHIGGLALLYMSLHAGNVNLLDEAFSPDTTIPLLRRERVSYAGTGTPFHMAYLAAQRAEPGVRIFPDLKCCPGGGAPKPPTLHAQVKAELGGAGIVSGWGLTEAPILTNGSPDDPDDKLALTEGRPLPGVLLRVVRADGTEAGPGEEGELRAKAPQVMLGYVDPSLDAEAFDADGWFRSGDLGTIDEGGYVVITGRLKDVIIRHGENVSAKEVEDLLFEHPDVADVAVVGIPDEVTGERVVAVVSTPEGRPPLGFAAMRSFLLERGLRRQAVPEQLEHVDVVPRNPSGKITKNVLKEQIGSRSFTR